MRKHIFLFILCALSPLLTLAQVKVSARLDSTRMMVGAQCELAVEVNAPQGAAIQWPELKGGKLSPEIEVVDKRDDNADGESAHPHRRIYTITAWDEGKLSIPSLSVKVNGKDYQTAAIPLEVTTVAIDSLHPDTPKPPFDIQELPFDWNDWLPIYLWSLLALALMLLAWFLYSRLCSGKPIISRKQTIHHEPPHQKALRRIRDIKQGHTDDEADQKAYYTQLTEALRKYMSERFGFNAMGMTSQEIIDQLKHEQDQSKIDELRELFSTADLVKFARFSADRHIGELYLSNVVQFINDTKEADTPTEIQIEKPLSSEERLQRRHRRGVRIALGVVIAAAAAIVTYTLYMVYQLL